MKIIFLDIDGVLNHDKWYVSKEFQALNTSDDVELDVDPKCAERINIICKETGAKIVISSDWRISSWYGTIKRLERGGINIDNIIDKTPEHLWKTPPMFDRSRGSEIDHWLIMHPECEKYVIIDDRMDFKKQQRKNFVNTKQSIGLTDSDMEKAIAILNKN